MPFFIIIIIIIWGNIAYYISITQYNGTVVLGEIIFLQSNLEKFSSNPLRGK